MDGGLGMQAEESGLSREAQRKPLFSGTRASPLKARESCAHLCIFHASKHGVPKGAAAGGQSPTRNYKMTALGSDL